METILLDRDDTIAVITLNRPDRLNAINDAMVDELRAALVALGQDESVRVAIITGAGDKAFCVGMDLKERKDISEATLLKQRVRMVEMFAAIRHFAVPLIAAANGYALGGGLEIALNSDFIVASSNATFGMPEVTRGIMPGGGGTQLLPQRIGIGRARELIYTGETIDAEKALAYGLINRLVPLNELMPTVKRMAQKIADSGPVGVRQSKRAINFDQSIEAAIRFEAEAYHQTLFSEDRREGFIAFNEKRKPIYKGK